MSYFNTKGTFGSTASPGRAKVSECCFHICLSCAILCQMVPFQYSSRLFVVSPVTLGIVTLLSVSLFLIGDVHQYMVVLAQAGLVVWNNERNYLLYGSTKPSLFCVDDT